MWWSSLLSTLELKNAANRGKMPQTLLFSFNLNNQTKADLVKLTHPMASALAIICADIWWYMQVNHYIIYIYIGLRVYESRMSMLGFISPVLLTEPSRVLGQERKLVRSVEGLRCEVLPLVVDAMVMRSSGEFLAMFSCLPRNIFCWFAV